MAKIVVDSQRKREVLYGDELSPEQMSSLAREYLSEGLPGDAVQFLECSKADDAVAQLKTLAFEHGDAFILAAAAKVSVARGDSPLGVSNDDWVKLAARARELGKELYALRAEHILGGGEPMGHIDPPEELAEPASDEN